MSRKTEEVTRCDSCGCRPDGDYCDFVYAPAGHKLCDIHDLCSNCLHGTDYKYCQVCDPARFRQDRVNKYLIEIGHK